MKRIVILIQVLMSVCIAFAQIPASVPPAGHVSAPFSSLDEAGFRNPDRVFYPMSYLFYIDGNVEREGITKDLQAMRDAELSGFVFMHGGNFGGTWPGIEKPIYCLDSAWYDIIEHTASEANRLGLRFVMADSPGWALAGGPWIKPSNAMRTLVMSKNDVVSDGHVELCLSAPADMSDADVDYKDIMVVAFKGQICDSMKCLKPSEVVSDIDLLPLLSGMQSSRVALPVGKNNIVIRFRRPSMVRSMIINNPSAINHAYCSELGTSISVRGVSQNGDTVSVLSTMMPMGSWQDNSPTLTFATDEIETETLIVDISNPVDFPLNTLQFFSASRKNNWESESGRCLRSIPYECERPVQSAGSFVSEVLDVTDRMDGNGILRWNAPKGLWTVLRIGHVNAGMKNGPATKDATGWECDKYSVEGADAQFAGYIGKLVDGRLGGLLSGTEIDSWECASQTWTRDMEKEFLEYTGYSLRPWIPSLFGYVVGDHARTASFLRDWRAVLNHLVVENFYGRMAENASSKGLSIQNETACGDVFTGDIMEYYKYSKVPMTEFWHHSTTDNYVGSINFKPIRPTASAAHLYGKPRVSAESFTSFWLTWNEDFSQLRTNAARNFAQGVTHAILHTYTHNPMADSLIPGTSFGSSIGTPFLRGQTWWKHMPSFTGWLARCTYMLERGLPSSDVLWYLSDDLDHKPDQRNDYMPGYSYDYCNHDVLMNRLSVENGKIVTPEGVSYRIIWIPKENQLTPETVIRLSELVKSGARVAMKRPEETISLIKYDTSAYRKALNYLFDSERVYQTDDILKALLLEGVERDVTDDSLLWNHRRIEGAEWYYIAAPEEMPFNGKVGFRCTGTAEIWNPVNGEIMELPVVRDGSYSYVSINLEKGGSQFLVFRKDKPYFRSVSPVRDTVADISKDWILEFPEGWGAPRSLKLDTLAPWKDLNISPEGKSFSGTATYKKSFLLKKKKGRYLLSLGDVSVIARVTVNGRIFQDLWCAPFETDITDALNPGQNSVEVEVTSTWFNRLAYDAAQKPEDRKTWTIAGPSGDSLPVPSGLLGPVRIIREK